MTRKIVFLVLLSFCLAACMPGSKATELAALLKEAPQLFQVAPHSGPLPREKWPAAVSELGAEKVYARPEGLYIVTSTFFVEEKGLFLPRSAVFQAQTGTDPQYKLIVKDLYSYRIKG
jgi:hypothetical protein